MAALATVDDLEVIAGPQSNATRANRLLEMSSAVVERWCRRKFARVTDDTRTVEVTNGVLRLPDGPVVSVTSITGPTPSVATYASSGYSVRPDGTLWRTYTTGLGWMNGTYSVVYTHGYSPIPDDVIVAVCQIAERVLTGPGGGLRSEAIGEASFGYDAAWTAGLMVGPGEQALLAPFRRLGAPIAMTPTLVR